MANRFTRGDYVRFEDYRDGSVYQGAALDTRGYSGLAPFRLRTEAGDVDLNLNYGTAVVLFRADVAREEN